MPKFFIKTENLKENKEIWITGSDVNHIKNVLRMPPGEEVMVSFGKGMDYHCRIRTLEKDCIWLEWSARMMRKHRRDGQSGPYRGTSTSWWKTRTERFKKQSDK